MADDGNLVFRFWDLLIDEIADGRPGGVRPARLRRLLPRYYQHFVPQLERIRPYFEIPMPEEPHTDSARLAANIEAIRLLASRDAGVDDVTKYQTYARYTGFGGLSIEKVKGRIPERFHPSKEALAHEYYTTYRLAEAIAELLCPFVSKLADPTGRVRALEPSAGIGRLINAFNRNCMSVSILWDAAELSPIAAEILSRKHPEVDVFRGPYERFNERRSKTSAGPRNTLGPWNLVLANPPFGSSQQMRLHALEDTDPDYREKYDYPYFLRRGLDSLSTGGIGAYILPKGFLDGDDFRDLRETVLRRHHLIGAFRIPSHKPAAGGKKGKPTFPGQMTVTDLVVFRSRGLTLGKVDSEDQFIVDGEYFEQNSSHVLGKVDTTFRYAVVGDFDGFPELVERPMCVDCTPESPRRRRPAAGSVARLLEDEEFEGLEWLVRASVLGKRVDRFTALRAHKEEREQERAIALWPELHDALLTFVRERGNPHENDHLLGRRKSESIAALLRAFEIDGQLVAALQKPPAIVREFNGDVEDVEAQARWRYGELQELTVDEFHRFHASVGGSLARGELIEKLLNGRRWFIDGELLMPREIYLSGDLWPRYERIRNATGDPQLAYQQSELQDAILPRVYADIAPVSPLDSWIDVSIIAAWMSDELNEDRGRVVLTRDNGIVQAASSNYTAEVLWCIAWLNHILFEFQPTAISNPQDFYRYGVPEIIGSPAVLLTEVR